MAVMGEARSTPTYPSVAPPRYGGCVSAFLHFFDWIPAKRFSSTKRLSASKPEKAFRRSRSFRGDHGSAGKTRMMCQSGGEAVLGEVPDGTRAPGVVARLMGLESLPQPQALHRDDRQGTPILLQDLLKRDYKGARKATLRERIPAIFPRRAAQEESKRRRKKSASLLTAFRCRPDVSPAYIDIPATSRFLSSVARSPQSPFVSRLPPGGELHKSPSPASNYNLLDIPELSLRASSTGTTGVVLQGWPLESQHIVPPDIFHEDYESTSVGSRPTDSASSKPLMAAGSHKVVHGRRRGSSWNGSEGSESTIEQDRKPVSEPSVSSSRHRTSRRHEPAFKSTRRPASSKSPKVGKRGADSLMENSRASSMSGASLGSVSSKTPTGLPGKSRASNPGHRAGRVDASTVVRCKGDDELHLRSRSPSRSKEIMAPGKPAPKVKNQRGAPSQSGDGVMTRPKVGVPSYGVRMFGGRKEGDKVKMESPALVQHLPTLQRFTEKAAGAGKQTAKVVQVQDLGERLKTGNVNGEEMATQSGVDDTEDSTTLRFKRKSKVHNKHARAPSVDDVFPELPFEFENCKEKCDGAMERVLLGQGLSSSPDQISSSPLVDYSSGVCMLGRLSDALVDYDELPCLGEYGKEAGGLSGSPLIECEELRSLGGSGPPASSAEEESIPSEVCQAQEAGGVDDLRWEDERVLRCCERSCSGPSISSESLPSDVEDERNGDSWSSCASNNNLGDCHSPRSFEITERDVEPESLNQEHQNSPPTQFVKKILDPTGLDLLVDEAGQPSPVSILNSPFHDEPCTASESSVTDSILRQPDCEEIVDELDALAPSCSASNVSNSDKIRQALLDISMFWSREEPSCTFEPPLPAGDTKDEQSFIRGVLSAAQFLSVTPGSSPDWHAKDVAIDPSLFDKLESGDMVEFSCQAAGGLWRCDRKLLFDCVNEAFGLTHLWHCQGGGHEVNWLQEELVVCRSSRPRGELLVVQVGKQIDEWRQLASYAIDSLIERDMSVHFGNWQRFGREAAEVGLEIEDTVWEEMLEEVVADMNIVSTSKQY